MSSLLLQDVTLPDGTVACVRTEGTTITEVAPDLAARPGDEVLDLAGHVVVPAPAEPHAHLDKALTADHVLNARGDLRGAIEAWQAHCAALTVEEVAERAERAVLQGVASGTTAIRTHVDVGTGTGLRAVEALLAVRDRVRDLCDLQVVALPSVPTSGAAGSAHRALLREALDMGVDVGGGCPHLDPDPLGCLDACLEAAADHGVPIDLHTDETLDPSALGLRDLAALVSRTGFPHGATASHCVSLGVQPPELQDRVAEEVAAAGVAVVTLPQTNLFLQGRDARSSIPRGLTALRPLLRAGATLAAGADNLQDPFNTMGRSDPLETAALLVMAGHLTVDEALSAVTDGARAVMGLPRVAVAPGSPAELLAGRAETVRELIASAPADRVVVHRGRVVARTTATTSFPSRDAGPARG